MTPFSKVSVRSLSGTSFTGVLSTARAVGLLALIWGAGYVALLAGLFLLAGIPLLFGVGTASLHDAKAFLESLLPGALKMGLLTGATFGFSLRFIGHSDEKGFLDRGSSLRAVLLGSPLMAALAIALTTGGRGLTPWEAFNSWIIVTLPALVLCEMTLKFLYRGQAPSHERLPGGTNSVIDHPDKTVVDASREQSVPRERIRTRIGPTEL